MTDLDHQPDIRVSRTDRLILFKIGKISALVFAGGLALQACGGSSDNAAGTSVGAQTTEGVSGNPTTSASKVELVFDDLGGGSTIIKVYPGVSESTADKSYNGTFNDGDAVPAECKQEGRSVHSDPVAGEEDRTSDMWVRIHGSPGLTQFATVVYVETPDDILSKLDDC